MVTVTPHAPIAMNTNGIPYDLHAPLPSGRSEMTHDSS
jgi:hypothetical protein